MAKLLLWVLGAALCGCVIPQDIPVLPDDVPLRNSPPFIVSRQPSMSVASLCPAQESFSIQVRDVDVNDTLYSVWYVQDPTGTVQGQTGNVALSVRPNGNQTRTLNPPPRFINDLSSLNTGEVRLVEVRIWDGDIEQMGMMGEYRPIPRDAGIGLPDESYQISTLWSIKKAACPTP